MALERHISYGMRLLDRASKRRKKWGKYESNHISPSPTGFSSAACSRLCTSVSHPLLYSLLELSPWPLFLPCYERLAS